MNFFDLFKTSPESPSVKQEVAPVCVGIGEILWDIVEPKDHSRPPVQHPGGAPFNFIYHAHQLGAKCEIISSVGKDSAGDRLLRQVEKMGVTTRGIQRCPYFHTGSASINLDDEGIPEYVIHPGVAWDDIEVSPTALSMVEKAEVIYYGSLAQRAQKSHLTIQKLLASSAETTLRVMDVNIRGQFYNNAALRESFARATIVKMSEEDLTRVAHEQGMPLQADKFAKAYFSRYPAELLAITMGENGSWLFTATGLNNLLPADTIVVKDTVGAGDAFTAALVLGWRKRIDFDALHLFARDVASYVCTQAGATPILPPHFRKTIGY